MQASSRGGLIVVAGATMALSGFLLFQVQPMMARYILPWFGGSATTWTICLLFFQVSLLLGYLYAHIFTRPLGLKAQVTIHIAVIFLALMALPITPADSLKPADADNPVWRILALLTLSVGLPYAVLSTTTPLVQKWLASGGSATPSRLFALSNLGSFLGLVSYPFVVDLYLPTDSQTWWWSAAFVVYALLLISFALLALRRSRRMGDVVAAPTEPASDGAARSAPGGFWLWFTISALCSVALLAVTNDITSYVSVNPFLWILPLSIYLLSFVIAFARPDFYRPSIFGPLYAAALAFNYFANSDYGIDNAFGVIAVNVATFAVCCMVCQGELARRQPPPSGLTFFYLTLAAGGAAGGAFVSLVAPVIFSDYWESPLSLLAVGALQFLLTRKEIGGFRSRHAPVTALLLVAAVGLAVYTEVFEGEDTIDQRRNFYGVLKVDDMEADQPGQHRFVMRQAGETQGEQSADPVRGRTAACYFGPDSGIGLAVAELQARKPSGIRVGVIGLGAGMLVAYGRPTDSFRYYELNPVVTEFAHEHFSYLKDAASRVEVAHGDGRLILERELKAGQPGNFDLLHLDAFRGNAPPAHLMTREAFEIYFRHLAEGGVLAVTSHRDYYDASSLFRGLADLLGAEVRWIPAQRPQACSFPLGFALFSRNAALFDAPALKRRIGPWDDGGTHKTVWTDQSSSLMSLMVWGR